MVRSHAVVLTNMTHPFRFKAVNWDIAEHRYPGCTAALDAFWPDNPPAKLHLIDYGTHLQVFDEIDKRDLIWIPSQECWKDLAGLFNRHRESIADAGKVSVDDPYFDDPDGGLE